MLLESIISLSIFVVIAVSMNNYIISSVKYLISNINISTNVLKIRELEVFLNSELNEYAFCSTGYVSALTVAGMGKSME